MRVLPTEIRKLAKEISLKWKTSLKTRTVFAVLSADVFYTCKIST